MIEEHIGSILGFLIGAILGSFTGMVVAFQGVYKIAAKRLKKDPKPLIEEFKEDWG